jgi:hypothetical protein
MAFDAMAVQPIPTETDDVEIAAGRNAREGNQTREHFAG